MSNSLLYPILLTMLAWRTQCETEVHAGQLISFTCNKTGTLIFWSRRTSNGAEATISINTKIRDSDPRYAVTLAGGKIVFTITNTTHHDSTQYSCYADSNPNDKEIHKLLVLVQPYKLEIIKHNEQVNPGDVITLRCKSYGGVPRPTIIWTVPGSRSNETEETIENLNGFEVVTSTINVTSTKRMRTEDIACKVFSAKTYYNASEFTRLDVQFRPDCVKDSTILESSIGKVANLPCEVIANPRAVSFQWVLLDGEVKATNPVQGTNYRVHSKLTQPLRKSTDFGSFICQAYNRLSSITTNCTVHLIPDRPLCIYNNTVNHVTCPLAIYEATNTTPTFILQIKMTITKSSAWVSLEENQNGSFSLQRRVGKVARVCVNDGPHRAKPACTGAFNIVDPATSSASSSEPAITTPLPTTTSTVDWQSLGVGSRRVDDNTAAMIIIYVALAIGIVCLVCGLGTLVYYKFGREKDENYRVNNEPVEQLSIKAIDSDNPSDTSRPSSSMAGGSSRSSSRQRGSPNRHITFESDPPNGNTAHSESSAPTNSQESNGQARRYVPVEQLSLSLPSQVPSDRDPLHVPSPVTPTAKPRPKVYPGAQMHSPSETAPLRVHSPTTPTQKSQEKAPPKLFPKPSPNYAKPFAYIPPPDYDDASKRSSTEYCMADAPPPGKAPPKKPRSTQKPNSAMPLVLQSNGKHPQPPRLPSSDESSPPSSYHSAQNNTIPLKVHNGNVPNGHLGPGKEPKGQVQPGTEPNGRSPADNGRQSYASADAKWRRNLDALPPRGSFRNSVTSTMTTDSGGPLYQTAQF